MIFATSISPNTNNLKSQIEAIKSWQKHGFPVYSVNTKKEIDKIKDLYQGVTFIEVQRDGSKLYGRGCIFINDILTHTQAYTDDLICLLNSDIILDESTLKMASVMSKAREGMVIVSRWNIVPRKKPEPEVFGIDIFMFTKRLVRKIPMNLFVIGQPFWDYWIPYHCVKNGFTLYHLQEPFATHRYHPIRWSQRNWNIAGEVFKNELRYEGDTEQFSKYIRAYFMSRSKKLTL